MELMSLVHQYGLFGIFFNHLLSSSILPLPSEPSIFLGLSIFHPVSVFFAALFGSVLGGSTNYVIGIKGVHNFLIKRSPKKEKKAEEWMKKWGVLIVFLAPWIYIIGDPALIAAGALKMDIKKFFVAIFLGNVLKISVIIYFSSYFWGII